MAQRAIAAIATIAAVSACGAGPRPATISPATPVTISVAQPRGSLRGVAGDEALVFAAITSPSDAPADTATTIEAWQGTTSRWSTSLLGSAGELTVSGSQLVIVLTGVGTIGAAPTATTDALPAPVRGEPGAAVVALDAQTGAPRWRVALDTDAWVVIAAIASIDGGVLVGGSFSGSLRAGAHVVTSAGRADGFVARLDARGGVAWVRRIGGAGPDAVQGVAARGDRIAIAGTFAAGAELQGVALPPFDARSPYTDGFVAALDPSGQRVWSASFGGKLSEAVAGVAIDARGQTVVAGSARDVIHVGSVDLIAQGPGDGLVAWWTADGMASHAVLVGGADFDGLRAIAAVGDRIVIAGFYSGSLRLGDRELTAAGGDGAFIAALDPRGAVLDRWEIEGPGREDVTALAAIEGGFVAGIAYTGGAKVGGAQLEPPRDGATGAAVIVRPVR